MTVVHSSVMKGPTAARKVAWGAALVEIFQSGVALYGGHLVTRLLAQYPVLELLVFGAFIVVGLILFRQNARKNMHHQRFNLKMSGFTKGMLVGLLNPQAIPFWIFCFTFFQMHEWLHFQALYLTALFAGIFAGKFIALAAYASLGMMLTRRVRSLENLMNKILASVFILIGLIPLIRYFWG
ncbi:MAG: LysE family transporter [Bacteroidia bacterium]|nr:LysE family transporter [Bacteroidia bacterium]